MKRLGCLRLVAGCSSGCPRSGHGLCVALVAHRAGRGGVECQGVQFDGETFLLGA